MKKIKIHKSRKKQPFRFTCHATNGKIVASSESYFNLDDLLKTVTEYFPDWGIEYTFSIAGKN